MYLPSVEVERNINIPYQYQLAFYEKKTIFHAFALNLFTNEIILIHS